MFKECLIHLCGTTANSGSEIDMVSFWTFSLVLATLLLYLVARYQLSGINKTTKTDFIKRFNSEFFVDTTRNVIMLLDYNALEYKEKIINIGIGSGCDDKTFQYFAIKHDILCQLELSDEIRNTLQDKNIFTAFEIDDLLLGRFEDIGLFAKKGFLNIKDICNQFYWYIYVAWNNEEIQKYIKSQRNLYGESIYKDFEAVYKKCSKSNTTTKLWITLKNRLGGICE